MSDRRVVTDAEAAEMRARTLDDDVYDLLDTREELIRVLDSFPDWGGGDYVEWGAEARSLLARLRGDA